MSKRTASMSWPLRCRGRGDDGGAECQCGAREQHRLFDPPRWLHEMMLSPGAELGATYSTNGTIARTRVLYSG